MITVLFAAFLPILPQTSAAPAEEPAAESVLEVYDLRPLMPRFDAGPSWSRSLVLAPGNRWRDRESSLAYLPQVEEGGADVIVDLLTESLGDELRFEGRQISLEAEGRLLVVAPPAVQERVAATLAAFAAVLASSVQLTVDILDLEGSLGDAWPAASFLPAEAVERAIATALGRGGAHRRFQVGLSAGRTAGLDQMRRFPIVFDYDVEIAQGSFVPDPVVLEIEEGVRILLRGAPQAGGLALSVVFQSGASLGVKEHPVKLGGAVSREDRGGLTSVLGPQSFQAVDLLARAAAFDTFLPDGQALVFAAQDDLGGKQAAQIVYLRRSGGEVAAQRVQKLPGSTQTLLLVNSESVVPPAMTVYLDRTEREEPFDFHPDLQAVLSVEPSLFLFDWISNRFVAWRRLGPWAVMITDPAWDRDAAPALEALLASWKPRREVLGLEVTLSVQGGHPRVPVRWRLPVRPGSACGLLLAVSGSTLVDFDVEVAQFACVADPQVAPTFDGLCLAVTPSVVAGGTALDVRGLARLLARGPRPTFDPQHDVIGAVDQVAGDRLVIDERRVVGGAPASLVVGGDAKEGDRSVLRLEIGVR
ncbi:MAG: hypothetical protein AB1726_13210 [Planctomycetota bacterium]